MDWKPCSSFNQMKSNWGAAKVIKRLAHTHTHLYIHRRKEPSRSKGSHFVFFFFFSRSLFSFQHRAQKRLVAKEGETLFLPTSSSVGAELLIARVSNWMPPSLVDLSLSAQSPLLGFFWILSLISFDIYNSTIQPLLSKMSFEPFFYYVQHRSKAERMHNNNAMHFSFFTMNVLYCLFHIRLCNTNILFKNIFFQII